MKRILMTLALALPLAAVCVLPKSASAEPMNRDYNYNRQHDNIQRGNRDYNYNRQQDNEWRNNRIYNRDRQPNSVERYGNRRQRQWVAPHYERRNNILRWVLGRYIY
jgi:hypothetical protein